jgi:hypothetical protein
MGLRLKIDGVMAAQSGFAAHVDFSIFRFLVTCGAGFDRNKAPDRCPGCDCLAKATG